MTIANRKLQHRTSRDTAWIHTETGWEQVPVMRRAGPWVVHEAPNSRLFNVTLDGTGRAVVHDVTLVQATLLVAELQLRNHAALVLGERDGDVKRSWVQALSVAKIDYETVK